MEELQTQEQQLVAHIWVVSLSNQLDSQDPRSRCQTGCLKTPARAVVSNINVDKVDPSKEAMFRLFSHYFNARNVSKYHCIVSKMTME